MGLLLNWRLQSIRKKRRLWAKKIDFFTQPWALMWSYVKGQWSMYPGTSVSRVSEKLFILNFVPMYPGASVSRAKQKPFIFTLFKINDN